MSLTYYDPNKDVIIASDANNSGLDAEESDNQVKTIAHAPRERIQPNRKVSLGIIFGGKIFHRFVHRRSFILQMDHRPLLWIFGFKEAFLYILQIGLRDGGKYCYITLSFVLNQFRGLLKCEIIIVIIFKVKLHRQRLFLSMDMMLKVHL